MKLALLGLPQSGKKTLFVLLVGRAIPPGHSETESLEGIAPIRDPRVDVLAELTKPEKITYADNMVVLCPDVKEGSDKREWLDAARHCDLLCIVVRDFTSEEVYHPAGSVNAARDRNNLATELLLTDLMLVETRLQRMEKEKRSGQTTAQALEQKTLLRCKEALENEKGVRDVRLEPHELAAIKSLDFLTLKPILWVYNVDEARLGSETASHESGKDGVFVVSCRIEREVMSLTDNSERLAFMKELGLNSLGPDRLNGAAYDAMGLMSFYTIGPDEARAWTIRKGTLAPAAAGKVHTDIERGFIRAEVMKYDDLVSLGSEKAVKEAGKAQLKGKDYIMEDGDICHFRFNV
jgi:ribosome-binding ATPase